MGQKTAKESKEIQRIEKTVTGTALMSRQHYYRDGAYFQARNIAAQKLPRKLCQNKDANNFLKDVAKLLCNDKKE